MGVPQPQCKMCSGVVRLTDAALTIEPFHWFCRTCKKTLTDHDVHFVRDNRRA